MSAAIRYAKALFQLAEAAKQTQAVMQAAEVLQAAVTDESVTHGLANPRLSPAQRKQLAQALAKAVKAPQLLADTLGLLAAHNRLELLPATLQQLQTLADAANGTARVKVESAHPLDESQRKQITELVKKSLNSKTVVVEETVDATLIGGFRAFFGGQVWDVSLSGGLARLKNRFRQSLNQPQ